MRTSDFLLTLLFLCGPCLTSAQGVDAGVADPLRIGLIDPVILELGATYLYVAPLVVFVLGLLVVPSSLVFLLLIILPLYVPTSEAGRSFDVANGLSKSTTSLVDYATDCINKVMCETTGTVGQGTTQSETIKSQDLHRRPEKEMSSRSACSKYPCKPYDICANLLKLIRNA